MTDPWYAIPGYTPKWWHPVIALYAPLYEWKEPSVILVDDMFAGGWIDQRRDRVFAVMALCPQHLFVLVTNYTRNAYIYLTTIDREPHFQTVHRICEAWPENAAVPNYGITFPLPNLWLGTHVETQAEADERIPKLLATPAALQFVHVAPRERIDFSRCAGWLWRYGHGRREPVDGLPDHPRFPSPHGGIDWLVVEGGSDPMHPDHVRPLLDQCAAADVPFRFAGWGEWAPKSGGASSDAWGTICSSGEFFPSTTPWNGHDDDAS